MLSRRAALALVAAAPLVACATPPGRLEPPDVDLRDMRFVQAGLLQQEVELILSVANPNTRAMDLNGLRVALDLNGRPLAKGYADASLTVPRLSTITVPVRTTVGSLDLVQRIMALGTNQSLDYVLRGEAFVGGGGTDPLPFESRGSLSPMAGSGLSASPR